MTHRDKGPEPPPQRIESPGIADDKTRPLRTVENVDPDAPTVRMTTRPELQSPQNFLDDDEEDEEEASDEDLDEEDLAEEENLDEGDEDDKGGDVAEDLEEDEDDD